jgi:hypothetical protein
MASEKGSETDLIDLLSFLSSGGITVTVGGYPLLTIKSAEKAMEMEVQGVREAGLKLSTMIEQEEQDSNVLRASESLAGKLSKLGWRLTLYDKGNRLLAVGSGISRLTAHVSINPLQLRKLLEDLK